MAENKADFTEIEPTSILVPEFLKEEQLLHDQPPYNWLRLNDAIFPAGFFNNDEDFPLFLRAIALRDTWGKNEKGKISQIVVNALDAVSQEYKQSAQYTADKVRAYLSEYPYSMEYLQEKWKHTSLFRANGSKNPQSNFPNGTYARYAYDRLERDKAGLHADMAEGMPHLYKSTNVVEVVNDTGKSGANKYFRIVKQSEAL